MSAEPQAKPTIRGARPADALEIAGVHVRAWRVAYRGLIDEDFLASLEPERLAATYELDPTAPGAPGELVAVERGEICGFVTFGACRDREAAGEIRALYIDPAQWRRGLGRTLLMRARQRLRELGFREAVVWVLAGNDAAEGFYLLDGWHRDGAERQESPYGVSVRVFRLRRQL